MRWLRRTDNGHGNVKVKIICEGTHVGLDYEGPPPDWALLTQLIGALAGRPSGPTAFSPRVITLSDEASPAAPVAADASPTEKPAAEARDGRKHHGGARCCPNCNANYNSKQHRQTCKQPKGAAAPELTAEPPSETNRHPLPEDSIRQSDGSLLVYEAGYGDHVHVYVIPPGSGALMRGECREKGCKAHKQFRCPAEVA